MKNFFNKLSFFLGLIIVLFGAALVFQFLQFKQQQIDLTKPDQIFEIKPGSHIRKVAGKLKNEGLIKDDWLFIVLAKLEGLDTKIKAGEFKLVAGSTPKQLLQQFVKGRSIQYQHSIIEGRTFKELLVDLKNNNYLKHTINDMTNEQIMAAIGAEGIHPEGRFLPDTYAFPKDTSDIDYLKRAYQAMQVALEREWQKREKNLPYKTPYEALIMASIIEKETGVAFERPMIAAAFITRLRKNMKLQTDPTIIYGMGDSYKGDIRYKDLREDTPYNTYVHKGLTPTPIAMPGVLAIQAALHPADSKAIYFVSKGDGTHYFSKTLKEHNNAVIKYQLKGRAPKRKAESGK
ncbi:MAG: endolytic transglycosylase MltG [Gammaproteobacteria bacterium]|nr:endolytic transglycosylase MltG [Gammaproteobacteria bacterium]